jgi:hypothetical protein
VSPNLLPSPSFQRDSILAGSDEGLFVSWNARWGNDEAQEKLAQSLKIQEPFLARFYLGIQPGKFRLCHLKEIKCKSIIDLQQNQFKSC